MLAENWTHAAESTSMQPGMLLEGAGQLDEERTNLSNILSEEGLGA
jgi:hypothetical protein